MTANEPIKSHNFRAGGPTPQPRLSLAEQRLSRKRGTFSGIAFAGVTGGSHLNCPHSGDGSPRGGDDDRATPSPLAALRTVRYAPELRKQPARFSGDRPTGRRGREVVYTALPARAPSFLTSSQGRRVDYTAGSTCPPSPSPLCETNRASALPGQLHALR